MALRTHGTMAVDWENRIDFDRLRRERLAKAKALLAKSEIILELSSLKAFVEPKDEPSMFEKTTKSLSVSIALPGPISPSHHPGRPFASSPAACWLDV